MKHELIAREMNEISLSIAEKTGFERAYQLADAINKLEGILTKEYMAPIMKLQGSRLGFLTDKDREGGYPEHVVKKCLIEAVLNGLQPCNNQFNIIAGNMYPTKEGCGYRLNNTPGLLYEIVCDLPRVSATSAAVDANVKWKMFDGSWNERKVPIPIKIDKYSTVDSIIGKATRKARAWLLSTITGIEVTDGEITDALVVNEKTVIEEKAQATSSDYDADVHMMIDYVVKSKTMEDLEETIKYMPDGVSADERLIAAIEKRKTQLR